jgi:hypothetical protein
MQKLFLGVVEDRNDPSQLGRLRVRILGLHPTQKTILPTDDLPWATVISHDGSNSGLGTTPSFFVEGTWVLVCYLDEDSQEPCVVGGLPGKPKALGNPNIGFNDPNRRSTDDTHSDYDVSVYPTTIEVSDVHETARGSLDASNPVARDALRKTSVATADFDGFTMPTASDDLTVEGSQGGSFNEPLVIDNPYTDDKGTYKPTYPKNHVYNTETGHIVEFDDTTAYKRIHIGHASGSYAEWSNDGTYVSHVVSDMFNVIQNNSHTLVEGSSVETIDGSLKLKVNKSDTSGNNYDIEIGENANMNIMVRSGSFNLHINGNVNVFSNDDINMTCDNFRLDASNKVKITSGDKTLIDASGQLDLKGDPIDLNST